VWSRVCKLQQAYPTMSATLSGGEGAVAGMAALTEFRPCGLQLPAECSGDALLCAGMNSTTDPHAVAWQVHKLLDTLLRAVSLLAAIGACTHLTANSMLASNPQPLLLGLL